MLEIAGGIILALVAIILIPVMGVIMTWLVGGAVCLGLFAWFVLLIRGDLSEGATATSIIFISGIVALVSYAAIIHFIQSVNKQSPRPASRRMRVRLALILLSPSIGAKAKLRKAQKLNIVKKELSDHADHAIQHALSEASRRGEVLWTELCKELDGYLKESILELTKNPTSEPSGIEQEVSSSITGKIAGESYDLFTISILCKPNRPLKTHSQIRFKCWRLRQRDYENCSNRKVMRLIRKAVTAFALEKPELVDRLLKVE